MRPLLLLLLLSPCLSLLTTFSLNFDFHRVPFAVGIRHIHSPEHVSETHRLGAPFFTIDSVDEPKNSSISFVCSTLITKCMRIRMFSRRPDESHLLFFKDGRALYGVKFTVVPIDEVSHHLRLDVSLFTGHVLVHAIVKMLMPVVLFINGMEDKAGYCLSHEDAKLAKYSSKVINN